MTVGVGLGVGVGVALLICGPRRSNQAEGNLTLLRNVSPISRTFFPVLDLPTIVPTVPLACRFVIFIDTTSGKPKSAGN